MIQVMNKFQEADCSVTQALEDALKSLSQQLP